MQAIFSWDCGSAKPSTNDSIKIVEMVKDIDDIIRFNAPKWPLDKINKVDLAVLRCAVWELLFQKNTPPKVVIDESVELSKEFGNDKSSSFINGVLGSIIKQTSNESTT